LRKEDQVVVRTPMKKKKRKVDGSQLISEENLATRSMKVLSNQDICGRRVNEEKY
jgi:hypothetical protein